MSNNNRLKVNKNGIGIVPKIPRHKKEGLEYSVEDNHDKNGRFKEGNTAASLKDNTHYNMASELLDVLFKEVDDKNRLVDIVDTALTKAENGNEYFMRLFTAYAIQLMSKEIKQEKVDDDEPITITLPLIINKNKKEI